MTMNSLYRIIQLNRLVKNHRVKFAAVLAAHHLNLRHLFLRFDPVMACNLRCQMCYFSDDQFRKDNKGIFKQEEINRLAEMFFPKAVQLVIGCGAEPTLYKDYPSLVKLAKEYKVPFVGLTSSGQLITAEHLERLFDYGLNELSLSVHGVKQETYERLMVNASYERFHGLLSQFATLTQKKRSPHLRFNYTVNPDNLDELADFFKIYGRYPIKTLQVRPIMDIGQSDYRNFGLSLCAETYNRTIESLAIEAKERGITFLANRYDPTYDAESENYGSVILDSVHRYISPQRVWRHDFNWREETYEEFCHRIGWSQRLRQALLSRRDSLTSTNPFSYTLSGRYDVKF
ncbi:MAG: radical SAM protein [Acidobacteria bacterium]|nr:radical SAM protein [Acidobacteriota bacterium]